MRAIVTFGIMAALLVLVGLFQSWNLALTIVNLCLISSVMALGVNIQWGYAGLFNVGIMGFAALGGLAVVLITMPPVGEAWAAGGVGIAVAGAIFLATIVACVMLYGRMAPGRARTLTMLVTGVVGYILTNMVFNPAVDAVEMVSPAKTGYLGGLGLPVLLAWPVGALMAGGAAWVIGKIALGLRSDYLAIATLGISEIIVAVMKNEDWLARGVKNVNGIPRWPIPYEINLQKSEWFLDFSARWGADPVVFSSIFVKLCYAFTFLVVLLALLWLSQRALNSPWGRMMRAIRDNEVAASAMGKNVTARHLQVFVLGSAVVGLAGAMLTTLDGQLTPASYQPLRYTFLIWVMVIVGGSGNNLGSVLGGFLIWFTWVQAETAGPWLMTQITSGLPEGNFLRDHLIDSAQHMRLVVMGVLLLVVLRFSPRGLLPEK